MTAQDLTIKQIDELVKVAARQRRYHQRLIDRMKKLGWEDKDHLFMLVWHTRNHLDDLISHLDDLRRKDGSAKGLDDVPRGQPRYY